MKALLMVTPIVNIHVLDQHPSFPSFPLLRILVQSVWDRRA